MFSAIFAGYIILHQQVNAKPWNHPPGFISDFRENNDYNYIESRHPYGQVQSRSGEDHQGLVNRQTGDEKEWHFKVFVKSKDF